MIWFERQIFSNSLSCNINCRISAWWVPVDKFDLIQIYVPFTNRHSDDSTELEVKSATQPQWALDASESVGKEENSSAAGVTDPAYQGQIGLLVHNGGKEECVGITGNALGHFFVLPSPVIEVSGKPQQRNPGGSLMAQTSQEWRFGSPTRQRKNHDQLRCLMRKRSGRRLS